jgi:hypothetical protein
MDSGGLIVKRRTPHPMVDTDWWRDVTAGSRRDALKLG